MIDYEQFESLDPKDQQKIFSGSSVKDKGELLLRAHEPSQLIRALSQEELYLVAREMDTEERSEIIRYANIPQLLFISDLECWQKDRLDSKIFLTWLETLRLADDSKLLAWLAQGDYELVVAGLQKIVQVVKGEREYAVDELLGDHPYFTLDDTYFISVREEEMQTVRRVFELLFENYKGRYYSVLEGIMSEMEDQIEDEAFQSRESRLAQRGFPEPEIAQKVYCPITREEWQNFPLKTQTVPAAETLDEKSPAPKYPALRNQEDLFFDAALKQLDTEDPRASETVREELAWLANKIIACQGVDLSSEAKVINAVERAKSCLNAGLEELSGRNLTAAQKILKERWLETVFRWGVSLSSDMTAQIQTLIRQCWNGQRDKFLNFLNAPYDAIARGILSRPMPEFYDFEAEKGSGGYRDFRNLEEIRRVRASVEQILGIHAAILKTDEKTFKHLTDSFDVLKDSHSFYGFIVRLFAGYVLNAGFSADPVSVSSLKTFAAKAFLQEGSRRVLNKSAKESFLNAWISREDERDVLRVPVSLALEQLTDQMQGLDLDREKDLKYITLIELKGRSSQASGQKKPRKKNEKQDR